MVDRIYSAVQNTCCADRDYASSTQSYGQVLNTYSAAHFANQTVAVCPFDKLVSACYIQRLVETQYFAKQIRPWWEQQVLLLLEGSVSGIVTLTCRHIHVCDEWDPLWTFAPRIDAYIVSSQPLVSRHVPMIQWDVQLQLAVIPWKQLAMFAVRLARLHVFQMHGSGALHRKQHVYFKNGSCVIRSAFPAESTVITSCGFCSDNTAFANFTTSDTDLNSFETPTEHKLF